MSEWRGLQVGFVAAVAVAIVGLVSGVESSGRQAASYREQRPAPANAAEARSYRDMRTRDYGPNAAQAPGWWNALRGPALDLFVPVVQSAEDRARALEARAGRRAYDGAPPTIPHAVDQLGVPACLACHADGARVAGKRAPVMSHDERTSCLQCHVTGSDPRPAETPVGIENSFVGLRAPAGGERAWEGAPPTMPHAIWMREHCLSCHGPRGPHGIRSTHPWRQSCTQCHAPSAVLEQRAPAALGGAP